MKDLKTKTPVTGEHTDIEMLHTIYLCGNCKIKRLEKDIEWKRKEIEQIQKREDKNEG